VKELKDKPAEAFVPLNFDPGEAIQVDWGEAIVYIKGKKTKVHVFCGRLCFSAMPFVMAFPHPTFRTLEPHGKIVSAQQGFVRISRTVLYPNIGGRISAGLSQTPGRS